MAELIETATAAQIAKAAGIAGSKADYESALEEDLSKETDEKLQQRLNAFDDLRLRCRELQRVLVTEIRRRSADRQFAAKFGDLSPEEAARLLELSQTVRPSPTVPR